MNYARILVVASVLAALAACQPKGAASSSAGAGSDTSAVLATVNGTPITENFLDTYVKAASQGKASASTLTPEQKSQVVDQLIRVELVAQQAEKDGVDKLPDTANELQVTRLDILQRGEAEHMFKDKPPSDADLHAEYDKQIASLPQTEYHAHHILVATQAFAQRVIDRLGKGEKFDDIAKKESMDSSKDSGGDLGWFTPDRMEKPFAEAVVSLKPGDYTHTPVQTRYGWHVIELVEVRPLQPPAFDQVKQRVAQIVDAKRFKAFQDDLLAKAKVDRKTPAPAATTPPPPANKAG
jgi:peptidyl-prolyl cis-trans isomerase C